jgi:hypothetical protein
MHGLGTDGPSDCGCGIVTLAGHTSGPWRTVGADHEAVRRLDLGATFVGREVNLIRASIEGNLEELKAELMKARSAGPTGQGPGYSGSATAIWRFEQRRHALRAWPPAVPMPPPDN